MPPSCQINGVFNERSMPNGAWTGRKICLEAVTAVLHLAVTPVAAIVRTLLDLDRPGARAERGEFHQRVDAAEAMQG
jgi:hypothetical protein